MMNEPHVEGSPAPWQARETITVIKSQGEMARTSASKVLSITSPGQRLVYIHLVEAVSNRFKGNAIPRSIAFIR